MMDDIMGVRRTLAAAIKKPCAHNHHEVLHSAGGAFDDHSTEWTRCFGCGGFFTVTVWLGREDSECVEIAPMSAADVAKFAPEYTEQVVHSRGAA